MVRRAWWAWLRRGRARARAARTRTTWNHLPHDVLRVVADHVDAVAWHDADALRDVLGLWLRADADVVRRKLRERHEAWHPFERLHVGPFFHPARRNDARRLHVRFACDTTYLVDGDTRACRSGDVVRRCSATGRIFHNDEPLRGSCYQTETHFRRGTFWIECGRGEPVWDEA